MQFGYSFTEILFIQSDEAYSQSAHFICIYDNLRKIGYKVYSLNIHMLQFQSMIPLMEKHPFIFANADLFYHQTKYLLNRF